MEAVGFVEYYPFAYKNLKKSFLIQKFFVVSHQINFPRRFAKKRKQVIKFQAEKIHFFHHSSKKLWFLV